MDKIYYFICPICKNQPFFKIIRGKNEELYINYLCHCGKFSDNYDDFLKKFIVKNITNIEGKCTIHLQDFISYCMNCKENICKLCKNEKHINHFIIDFPDFNLEEIKNNINDFENYILKYLFEIKENIILEYKTIIENIEKEYMNFKEKNFNILNQIKNLYNNAKNNINYQNISNLLNNSNFIFYELNLNELNLEEKREKLFKILNNSKPINLKKERKNPKRIDFLINEETISEHKKIISHIIQLNDGNIASCSMDNYINIYNNETYKILSKTKAHDLDINYITQIKNGNIISCSKDKSLKIWEYKNNNLFQINILLNHTLSVNKVYEYKENYLISCSDDSTLKIWNNNINIRTINNHNDSIVNILLIKKNNILISASRDKLIYFWNIENFSIKGIIKNIHCYNNNSMEYNNKYLFIGGLKGIICICNINTYQKICEIYAHKSYVTSIINLNNNILLSSGGYNEIKEWLIPKMTCISKKENLHNSCIYDMIKIKNKIYTSSMEIKVWSI